MRYILLFLFIIINAFIFTMNYEMFTIADYINYGNGTFYISPIMFVILIGFLFLLSFFLLDSIKEAKKDKLVFEKDAKISQLESQLEISSLKLENRQLKEETVTTTTVIESIDVEN